MGRNYVRLSWKTEMEFVIAEGKPVDEVLTSNQEVKWLVAHLTMQDVPYRLVNLGAGAKRVTTKNLSVCGKCNGTGKI